MYLLSPILYCVVVSISGVMSQTSELSSHYQHRLRMTMCQDFGKDTEKKKGQADRTNCRHVHSIGWEMCSSGKGSLLLWGRSLAWILESSTDLGGGMNGWLKRLRPVAVCWCQLCSEVEMAGEEICCKRSHALAKVRKLPWAIREANIQGKSCQSFLTQLVKGSVFLFLFSSLKMINSPLINICSVPHALKET